MEYRDLLTHAPVAIRDELQSYYDREDHSSIAEFFEENFDLASTPALQLIHACAIFSHAFEIMVDELIPASREALNLIEQAERRGLSTLMTSPYRSEIEFVLEEEIKRVHDEIADAMAALDCGSATADQIATLAYEASDTNYNLAAEYFLKAAELETQEARQRSQWGKADGTMNHLARAGINFAKAGEFTRAYPYLRQTIDFDWEAGRLWADRHMVEWAFVAILRQHASIQDWDSFRTTWEEALVRTEQLDMKFPIIYTFQEEILTVCIDNRILEFLPIVISAIESRESRINNDLNERIVFAKTLLDG